MKRFVIKTFDFAGVAPRTPLERDGFSITNDWNLSSQHLQNLTGLAEEALQRKWDLWGRGFKVINMHLPIDFAALNASMLQPARAYLGDDAELSGYSVIDILPSLHSTRQYISGQWHHDRCGKRLKAFLLLDDVTAAGGHMTRVVAGTHNKLHEYESFADSRKVGALTANGSEAMIAPRGGGYVFDTNAVHRGEVAGTARRRAIMFEFNKKQKSALLKSSDASIPCPSHVHPVRSDLASGTVINDVPTKPDNSLFVTYVVTFSVAWGLCIVCMALCYCVCKRRLLRKSGGEGVKNWRRMPE